MDPQLLLNKTTPKLTPKITKISSLVEASTSARKSSTKLRKVFEKGTYQKKTQLSVLNRYKRRLDSIQKQNDKAFSKKRNVKVKLPTIKKYVGGFFSAGGDPLKQLGQLAAFNALAKGSKGDILGSLGPAAIAAAILFGPAFAGGARSLMRGSGAASAGGGAGGAITPPWWMKNTKSLGRSNESYARYIAGEANIGDRARLARRGMIPASGMFSRGGTDVLAKQAGKPLAKEALGRFGKAIIPGVGAGFSFYSARERDKAGDKFGSSIDNIAGSLDAFAAGVQLYAAASAATGVGVPVAGFIEIAAGIAAIGSFSLDMFNLFRDLTGQSDKEAQKNRLEKQTQKQKSEVEKKKGEQGKLTFSKTLNSYDKAVTKFENFAKGFSGGGMNQMTEGGPPTPPPSPTNPYTGPISKDAFFPLPGGVLSTRANGYPGGEYGAQRTYEGGHSGQDIGGLNPGSPVVAWKTGTVTVEPGLESGDHIISVDHGNGIKTVYKHVVATVANGDTVYGGQQIASLYDSKKWAPHLHFEVWNGGNHINPNPNLSASQKIPSPLEVRRAKEHFQQNSQPQNGNQPGAPPNPEPVPPGFQNFSKIKKAFIKKGDFTDLTYNGKRYSFTVDPDGQYRVKDLSSGGLFPWIDVSDGKNLGLFSAIITKMRSMYPASSPVAPAPPSPAAPLPSPVPPQPSAPLQRQIDQYPSYQEEYVIRVPVPRQQQVAPPPAESMSFSGPSEQQLLNTFYKRVLLNTVS